MKHKNGNARSKSDPKLQKEKYYLRLFVTGRNVRSLRSIANLRRLCEEHLQGRYELEIVDIRRHPTLASEYEIIAAPTVVKSLPLPLRRLVGDFSNLEIAIAGLGLKLTRTRSGAAPIANE